MRSAVPGSNGELQRRQRGSDHPRTCSVPGRIKVRPQAPERLVRIRQSPRRAGSTEVIGGQRLGLAHAEATLDDQRRPRPLSATSTRPRRGHRRDAASGARGDRFVGWRAAREDTAPLLVRLAAAAGFVSSR